MLSALRSKTGRIFSAHGDAHIPSLAGLGLIVEKTAHIPAPTLARLCPIGVPIGTVWAFGASLLSAPDHLLSHVHLWLAPPADRSRTLELSSREDLKTTQIVLVQFFDRIEQIAVEGHQAT